MNWKDFLKPDWKKILLFIILFLILPIPVQNIPICKPCIEEGLCGPCVPEWYDWAFVTFGGLRLFFDLLDPMDGGVKSNFTDFYILFGVILFHLFISYLISCLIIFIYKKVKK
ncbi:MAG: hypothetical protein ACE5J4_02135 [Candidatus Aenigmatarchaeota archaeon]